MGRDCKYCGAYISDMVEYCPACGKKVKPEKGENRGTYEAYGSASAAQEQRNGYTYDEYTDTQAEQGPFTYKQEYEQRYGQYKNAGDHSTHQKEQSSANTQGEYHSSYRQETKTTAAVVDDDDVKMNKSMAYLCYMGPLFLIPYLLKGDSPFIKFHSNQGLLLLIACILVKVCGNIPVIGWAISIAGGLFSLSAFFQGLSNVSKGIKKPLPIIGEIKILN